jgi:small subunit ribosomal protein S4
VCRLCRAEGTKLFLKGSRCYTEKCAIERRNFAPGMHGQTRRSKGSDFGLQLREKQKVKRVYGLQERQFRFYFQKAARRVGATGAELLKTLERRLDNSVFRTGFVPSRAAARQLVIHGYVHVNNRKINVPNYQVREGDFLKFQVNPDQQKRMKETRDAAKEQAVEWLAVNDKDMTAVVKRLPERADIQLPIQEQLIVELYSK